MSRGERNEKVEYALRGARLNKDWIRIECPFCADDGHRDSKRSMGVSATTGYYTCYRCGEKGRLEEPPNPELVSQRREAVEEEIKSMEPPEGFCRLWQNDQWDSLTLEPARRYLKSRHVTRRMMRELQIGCCDEGWYAGRVVIPMLSVEGDEWYGYVTRLWQKKPHPRAQGRAANVYLYPPGMQRGRFLWNHPAVLEESDDPVFVVEGVFDALPFYPNAVATLGKLSEEQEDALCEAKRPVVFIPDGDAWLEGLMLSWKIKFGGQRAGCVRLPPRVDPDEVDKESLCRAALASLDTQDPIDL